MGNVEPVRHDINMLVARNFGEDVGNFFSNAYEGDTLPTFLHNSFIILKELMGENKAREELDTILIKYSVSQKYD